MRLAAIDIGSNAVRLLISEVNALYDRPIKLKLLRIPIRLGMDTFSNGIISEKRESNLIKTLKIYQLLMEIYEVKHYRACATSAMRCATNHPQIIKDILDMTGINIDVISGREEASIIFETHNQGHLDPNRPYLFIDVGGGSTELTLFNKDESSVSESFMIGTIRLLNQQVPTEQWDRLESWIRKFVLGLDGVWAVGSGGNINTIFQISMFNKGTPLSSIFIQDFCSEISKMDFESRMETYSLKPDRADVIGHACLIFNRVLKWASIEQMIVPQIGLSDGIIQQLAMKNSAFEGF